ncbi:hypothetical protein SASPL_150134 [Salvia splendens]|uniref:F-box domain-containing protein n=1 Tax=Salvia splendens TaxID=180675 RepID=A0A8X8W5K4_SALSN|nr:hypothetical protein SASPL_150134 [Salvia splendens]
MEEDRISQLPDEILQHILFFMDTSEAVKTSILSKRWKHLCRSLLNIRLKLRRTFFRSRFHRFPRQRAKGWTAATLQSQQFLLNVLQQAAAPAVGNEQQLRRPQDAAEELSSSDSSCVDAGQQLHSHWTAAAISSRSWQMRRRLQSAPRLTAVLTAGLTLAGFEDLAPLRDFHLSLDTEFVHREDEALVEECALYAINHGAQSFRILAPTPTLHALPAVLFNSATLRELVISQRRKSYTRTYKPTRFLLPNLKTLCLEATNLYFTSDVQGKELFSGLPELEKLFLIKFPVSSLVLKAPKLRVLEIIDSCCLIEEISAPLLTSFRYVGYFPLECSIMNVPMLEQVYLDIYGLAYNPECSIVNVPMLEQVFLDIFGPAYNPEWLHLKCDRLFHQLGNATTASLTLNTLKVSFLS